MKYKNWRPLCIAFCVGSFVSDTLAQGFPSLTLVTSDPKPGAAIFVQYRNDGVCQDRVDRSASGVAFEDGRFRIRLVHVAANVPCISGPGSVDTFELGRLPQGHYLVVGEYAALPADVYPFDVADTRSQLEFEVRPRTAVEAAPLWDFSGTYWSPEDSGWSLVVDQQPNATLIALWATYDLSGQSHWFYLLPGEWTAWNEYRAEIAEAADGPYFGRMPADGVLPRMLPSQRKVGFAIFRFSRIAPPAGSGSFEYTVDGVTTARSIEKFGIGR